MHFGGGAAAVRRAEAYNGQQCAGQFSNWDNYRNVSNGPPFHSTTSHALKIYDFNSSNKFCLYTSTNKCNSAIKFGFVLVG